MPKERETGHEIAEHLRVCPARGIMDVISKKWTFLIINELGNYEQLRFNDLMKQLEGVSPKTLSDTLKILESERLVKRESFNEIPPRVEYSLTGDGKELRKVIMPLLRWAACRSSYTKEKCALSSQNRVEQQANT
jgi:DNA-binding HxlR family transcriptional regulator